MNKVAGVRLALDWGKARIGVAACDAMGILAYPVETIPANRDAMDRIAQLVTEYEPVEIWMGLPIDLRGQYGIAAQNIITVARELAEKVGTPIRLLDERMTSVNASNKLAQAGRTTKSSRSVIDQAAAVEILQAGLAKIERTNQPAGIALEDIA